MAKRKGTGRRPTPEHTPQDDDIFVAKVVEYSTWAKRNTQTLVLGGIAVALGVAAFVYYANFKNTQEEQAILRLEAIQQTVAFGEPANARAELGQFLEIFGGTPLAVEARLLLAQLHLREDQAPAAIALLSEADVPLDDPLGPQTLTLLGKAQETAGQLRAAEETFLRISEGAPLMFQRHQALSDAARVRTKLGNPSGAAELFDEILAELDADHPSRGLYEMRRAEARTRGRL